MSEKELNKYRLTSMEEPTDEMLSQIMKEIAVDVKKQNAEAHDRLMADLKEAAKRNKERRSLQ
ncbi:MAG: hypothetical protein PHS04_05020 [Tissierellia bacterium]|nr:hypothetical protein [Tissierellia bacterium]